MADSSERATVGTGVATLARTLVDAVARVVVGKEDAVRLAVVGLLARGHLLIEDVPGTGKTTLARSLAAALGCEFRRIQFTPDLVPSDILGVNIYREGTGAFEFRPGPIFTQVVLADEINRATPRTQSALLESMQEGQVSIDGDTHRLPSPFLVIATQNPVEMDGTFRLPEAQIDRFLLRLELGYPDPAEETEMLARFEGQGPAWSELAPVATPAGIVTAQAAAARVQVGSAVREYVRRITSATRSRPGVRLGVSPRGSLALQRAAQAYAAMAGRAYVLPDDVKRLAPVVLGHRIRLETSAELRGLRGVDVVEGLVHEVEVPMEGGAAEGA